MLARKLQNFQVRVHCKSSVKMFHSISNDLYCYNVSLIASIVFTVKVLRLGLLYKVPKEIN